MATTTPKLKLFIPDLNERNWNNLADANFLAIEAAAPVSDLAVTPHESPSATLGVDVAGGAFVKADGTLAAYAGVSAFAVPASATTHLWLTGAGVLASGASWPTVPHVRLATVVSGASTVASVADARPAFRVAAPAQGPFASSYVGTSTTLGAAPTLADLTAYVNSLTAALKAAGAIQ